MNKRNIEAFLIILVGLLLLLFFSYSAFKNNENREKLIEDNKRLFAGLQIEHETNDHLRNQIKTLVIMNSDLRNNKIRNVKITFYDPSLGGINTDGHPNKNALMQTPIPGYSCAISRDLVQLGWLGKKVYIPDLGIFYIDDVMGTHVNGKKITQQIDVCMEKKYIKAKAKIIGIDNFRFVTVI